MAACTSRYRFSLAAAACYATLTASMAGQAGRGSVSGTVTDTSGAVVPDAAVSLREVKTGLILKSVTSRAGVYTFVSVSPSMYELTVTRDGFGTVLQKNVRVTVDQASAINVRLPISSVNETVTVDAADTPVNTSSATVGQLIAAETIDRVPLLTRNVYQLVQLSTGVSPANGTANSSDLQSINNARTGIDVSSYTINGALQGNVMFMLDGSPIGVAENNAATIMPAFQVPQDSVAEFRVETQNTPASYASGGGGVISLVSKSGGNSFHGDAFGYFRPNAIAANDFFFKRNNPGVGTPDFHRYQEGGAISGPIRKDKLFFFGDYEATQQAYLEIGSYTVPTAAERKGDFSADSFTIYNPLAPDDPTTGQRQPFAGNTIPTANIDPVARYFSDKLPLPTSAGVGPFHTNNLSTSGLAPLHAQKADLRLDYAPNSSNRVFARYSYGQTQQGNSNQYGSSNMFNPLLYINLTRTNSVLVGDDISLSPKTILQLRYSFTRHAENQTGDTRQSNYDITTAGFPQSLASQVLFKQIPVITFSDTAPVGGTGNYDNFLFVSENSDVNGSLTHLFGKHELSVGAEYQKKFMNLGQPAFPAGAYSFDKTATSSTTFAGDGSDWASFLLGMGSAPGNEGTNFTKDLFGALASPYYAAFVQDVYHITPRFTATLGARWEIFGGRTERHNRLEYFDPNLAYTLSGVSLTGGEQFVNSDKRSPFLNSWKNIGPRVSFAWEPLPGTVVRSGGGIYYGPSTNMVATTALNSDGFTSSTTWNATQYNSDGNTVLVNPLSNPFPNGVVQPQGSALGAATNVGVGLSTVVRNPRTLTTYNYNFGIEQQLPGHSVFTVAYVGSRGLFLTLGQVDLNTLPIQTIAQYGSRLCVDGSAGCQMVANNLNPILPATNPFAGASTVPLWVSLLPYPQFNTGSFTRGGVGVNGLPVASSSFNSLQTKVEKRLSNGLTFINSFTWGKLLTNASQTPLAFVGYHSGAPQDWRNLNLERAVSSQDVKFQFNSQISYDLPFGHGKLVNLQGVTNSLLGGWTLNTVVSLSTGVPIAVPVGTGNPYFNQRVDLTCDASRGASHTAEQWFSPGCFSQPVSQFAAGASPAYMSNVRTDGAHNLDSSLYKTFALPHENSLRLEVAGYDVTNTVQYGYPNVFWNPASVQDPTVLDGFGAVYSSANLPRQFQFGARYSF
ncbi:MAG: carboxypeptidase regulatory-like domain-containing protein [Janthinobacterium lividum]